MLATLVEEAVDFSYAATLAESGNSVAVKPSGTAKDMLISESETFGREHAENVQELPVRETAVPSGHRKASSGQVIGCVGCSTAFR